MPKVILQSMELPLAEGAVPDWIHLLPAGEINTHDNRGPYHVENMSRLITASLDDAGGRLPIDENHSTDLAAPKGEPSPARGWIVELEERTDGLFGKVEWTKSGLKLMADKAYRFISPAVRPSKNKTITKILRAALTNTPNLRGMAALNSETTMDYLEKLRKLLGLKDDADEDAVFTSVTELHSRLEKAGKTDAGTVSLQAALGPIATAAGIDAGSNPAQILTAVENLNDTTKFVSVDVVKDLQSELAKVTSNIGRDKAITCVDKAIEDGKPGVKPLRDYYIDLHMKTPDDVVKMFAALPSLTGTVITEPTPDKDGNVALNSSQTNIARLLGVDEKKMQETVNANLQKETLL